MKALLDEVQMFGEKQAVTEEENSDDQ